MKAYLVREPRLLNLTYNEKKISLKKGQLMLNSVHQKSKHSLFGLRLHYRCHSDGSDFITMINFQSFSKWIFSQANMFLTHICILICDVRVQNVRNFVQTVYNPPLIILTMEFIFAKKKP